ncbi:MAG: hypothetical protein AAFV80_15530, partial [Bacteroidota bacterium]
GPERYVSWRAVRLARWANRIAVPLHIAGPVFNVEYVHFGLIQNEPKDQGCASCLTFENVEISTRKPNSPDHSRGQTRFSAHEIPHNFELQESRPFM